MRLRFFFTLLAAILLDANAYGALTTNSWFLFSGKWENGANWSAGVPSSDDAVNTITNDLSSITVTVDTGTVTQHVINSCMTVSNLVVGRGSVISHTLFLNNANNTPGNIGMTILNSFTLNATGSLSITNSRLKVLSTLIDDGFVQLNTGLLTNGSAFVGNTGVGQMVVVDGTWQVRSLLTVGRTGGQGTVRVMGGTADVNQMILGSSSSAVGTIWLTGGELETIGAIGGTYPTHVIGNQGVGQVTVSNGTWRAGFIWMGGNPGGVGTLNFAGGMSTIAQLELGVITNTTSAVWITGGQLSVTGFCIIGESAIGQVTVSNGTWIARNVTVCAGTNTFTGVGGGSSGTLTVAGGTLSISGFLDVAQKNLATGTVWVTGGQVISPTTTVGESGVGTVIVSNGTWFAGPVHVGSKTNGQGTVTMAGGVVALGSGMIGESGAGRVTVMNGTFSAVSMCVGCGDGPGGTFTISGGQVVMTNGVGQIRVGGLGVGRMSVVGGSATVESVCVGCDNGPVGDLTMAGGSLTTLSNLVVGDCSVDGFGVVVMSGGSSFVTNAAHNATLEVRNGFFLLDGGLLVVDKLVATNVCVGIFDRSGGTLSVGTLVLDPNGDADGDGLPNGWEQAHGLDPLSSSGNNGPDGDPDGDGFTNLQEYLAGSDPQNPLSTPLQTTSLPRFTSILQSGNNIVLTWTATGGTTNQLQVTAGAGNGSYATNGFTNLGTQVLIGGSGVVTTNYTDVGGATNTSSRFYRVRLVP
jgi:hypothetical protein